MLKIKRMMKGLLAILLMGGMTFGCAELEVDNTNNPNTQDVLSDPADLVGLVEGAMYDLMWTTMTFRVVNFDLQADIITSTNAANNYWGDADEPRRRVDNTTTFDDRANIEFTWFGCNSANLTANKVIKAVEEDGLELIVNEEDVTQKTLAAAYMMKGISLGYIGYIYDKGFIVDYDTDVSALEFVGYDEMIAASVAAFESAKAIYSANTDATFDYITTGGDLSNTEAIQLANSYAARFMIGQARTNAEAATLDYNQIRTYAQGGLEADWSPISDGNLLYNGQHSWNTFQVDANRAAYLPVDLQVCYLFSTEGGGGSYAKTYPSSGILDPVTTNDARESTDFFYTTSLGWLREDRNRSIFSNYTFIRYEYNYQSSNSGSPMHIVTAAEADLIEAEAEARLGNYSAAKTIIDNGPRSTRGGLAALADNSATTVENAIWYENMIELHSSGSGIALAYMRRWDRMQEGSYLHLPVPAAELEIIGEPLYTFGGAGRGASEEGTATGSNSWKN